VSSKTEAAEAEGADVVMALEDASRNISSSGINGGSYGWSRGSSKGLNDSIDGTSTTFAEQRTRP
jgi:hypothetical protein